jgi:hypothetical protein
MGHIDPIETVKATHEEGNEGKKIGVERRNQAFYGPKLLKRQGQLSALRHRSKLFTEGVPKNNWLWNNQ